MSGRRGITVVGALAVVALLVTGYIRKFGVPSQVRSAPAKVRQHVRKTREEDDE